MWLCRPSSVAMAKPWPRRGSGEHVCPNYVPQLFMSYGGFPVTKSCRSSARGSPANAAPKGRWPRGHEAAPGRAGAGGQHSVHRRPGSAGPGPRGLPARGLVGALACPRLRVSLLPELCGVLLSPCSAVCAWIGGLLRAGRLYFLQNCLFFFLFLLSAKPRLLDFKQRVAPLT